jgi:hypothetical protein
MNVEKGTKAAQFPLGIFFSNFQYNVFAMCILLSRIQDIYCAYLESNCTTNID